MRVALLNVHRAPPPHFARLTGLADFTTDNPAVAVPQPSNGWVILNPGDPGWVDAPGGYGPGSFATGPQPIGPGGVPDPTAGYPYLEDPIAQRLGLSPQNVGTNIGFYLRLAYNKVLQLMANLPSHPEYQALIDSLLQYAPRQAAIADAQRWTGTQFWDSIPLMNSSAANLPQQVPGPNGVMQIGPGGTLTPVTAGTGTGAGQSLTDILRSLFSSSGPAQVPGGASGGAGTSNTSAPSAPLFAMSDVTGWLKGSTLITGVPNWGLVAVVIGGVVFFMLRRGK